MARLVPALRPADPKLPVDNDPEVVPPELPIPVVANVGDDEYFGERESERLSCLRLHNKGAATTL